MDTIETWSIHNMPRLNDPQGAIVYCRDLYNSCLGSSIVVHGTIHGANKRFYWGSICGKGGLSMAATLGPGTDFGGTFSGMTGPDPILLPTSRRGIARNRVWPRETLQYIHYNTSTYITIHAIDILGYT